MQIEASRPAEKPAGSAPEAPGLDQISVFVSIFFRETQTPKGIFLGKNAPRLSSEAKTRHRINFNLFILNTLP